MDSAKFLSRRTFRIVLILLATFTIGSASAADTGLFPEPGMERYEHFYEGLIGNRAAGFRVIIEKQRPQVATYYVGPSWIERPLTVVEQHEGAIVLRTQDGATFRLRFFYDDHTGAKDFYDSIGLDGTLETPSGSAPVKIHGSWSRTSKIGERFYDVTDAATDQEFESNVRAFVAAVLADDVRATARHVSFPMRSDFCKRQIRNVQELRTNWSWLFPADFKARLGQEVLHNLFVEPDSSQAFLLSGSIYFDAKGATLVRPPHCPARKSARR